MTKEEAILEVEKIREYRYVDSTVQAQHALDMAIEALKNERPKGHWILKHIETAPKFVIERFYCSECGEWQIYGMPNYCPNCGADMRGGSD